MSINQDPIVNVELSIIFNMKSTSFAVDMFKINMHVVVHYSYFVESWFCSRREEFVVIMKVNNV